MGCFSTEEPLDRAVCVSECLATSSTLMRMCLVAFLLALLSSWGSWGQP